MNFRYSMTMKQNTNASGEIHILVRNRLIDEFHHEDKTYVEGRKGTTYTIQYRNKTATRQKIVVSVDGLNVMTGDSTWENGYCVEPYQTINIPGWRKDSGNVAAFKFSSIRGSYNQQNNSGQEQNIGVIGCKVYSENKPPLFKNYHPHVVHHYHYEYPKYSPPIYPGTIWPAYPYISGTAGGNWSNMTTVVNNSVPVMSSALRGFNAACTEVKMGNSIGTGWGENKEFQTYTVNCEFNTYEEAVFVLYYDNIQGLRHRGIDIRKGVRYNTIPNPFPSDGCPPPIKRY
ncbi:MAG TPA: hypothetical protein VEP90_14775 [Methylomirabilota bacterium]|nr:hypothetical protein [Methylomirabilota bacterium]